MKRNWRSITVSLLILSMFAVILVRLYMIQIASARSFEIVNKQVDLVTMAQTRQNKEIVIQSGRGDILDRHQETLVGGNDWHLLIFPQSEEQLKLREEQFKQIAEWIHYPYEAFRRQLLHLKSPAILSGIRGEEITLSPLERERIEAMNIPGVMVVQSDQRMTLNQVAEQVIGQIARSPLLLKNRYQEQAQNGNWHPESFIGISGLEQAFEPFLHGEEEHLLIYTKARTGKPLNGVQMKRKDIQRGSGDRPKTLVTTLDKEIQQMAENLLQEESVDDGAVVIQEISSGDILAMASRPKGNSEKEGENHWENRAVMEATPGSIFKTVVAVAALDQGLVRPDTTFHCKGKLDQYHLRDNDPEGTEKLRLPKLMPSPAILFLAPWPKHSALKNWKSMRSGWGSGKK
ncbi:penicillin-binding transpeptidase domain-containing protein [Thermoactinomyces sp. Gus2-1]|uniref:penicillin-binding transpeptidase domain-containing protein n=1 Tax=Thermoactinomyces sp. Gus2-1 TaxID=1535750 RepID=UPI0005029A9B|nr:penicillin-binding transpeptidase domain-containing protein [Thermoactinomyces sp. Gus2-1]KFZ41425.1 hypothetical protein JS81_01115 [Thermoactinomyces sp. Gus2-1]